MKKLISITLALLLCVGCSKENKEVSNRNFTKPETNKHSSTISSGNNNETSSENNNTTSIKSPTEEVKATSIGDGTFRSEDGAFEYSFKFPKEIHVGDIIELTGVTKNNTDNDSVVGYMGSVLSPDEDKLILYIPDDFDDYQRLRCSDSWMLHLINPHEYNEYTRQFKVLSSGVTQISLVWFMEVTVNNELKYYSCDATYEINILE